MTRLLDQLRNPTASVVLTAAGRAVALSRRERQTLDQLSRDTSTPAVAAALGVSASTARWHIAALARKLGVATRQDVAELARVTTSQKDP